MTHRKAEATLGFPVEISDDHEMGGLVLAFGYVAGYPPSNKTLVIGRGRTEEAALEHLIEVHWEWMQATVAREQNYKCLFCGEKKALELDHIEMRSHGRSDARFNLRGLCNADHERRHRPSPRLSRSGQFV